MCNSNNVMDSFVVPPPLSLGLGRGLFTGLYQASVRLVPGCGAMLAFFVL